MRFAFIQTENVLYPITVLCRVMRVTTSGFYAWLKRPESERARRDRQLGVKIRALHKASRGTYGSPRIHRDLKAEGEAVGRKRVARLMREDDLTGQAPRRFRKTTDSAHNLPVAENVVDRNFNPEGPNRVWASDISYIRTWEGWLYLAVVIDLFSRRVVGWAIADHMRTELVLAALTMAVDHRRPDAGLVHHSDRGSQYASYVYQDALDDNGTVCSMSRKGDCWDNAVVESFFGTIKEELIHRHAWPTKARAKNAITDYIACFYNNHRRHSSLGYVSPMEYEAALRNFALAA